MTAWIWLYEKGSNPYATEVSYRFDGPTVERVAQAREFAASLYPDAPELDALVVIGCDFKGCLRRLLFSEDAADSITRGRELAAENWLRGGWYRALYRGRPGADICQWHYEVDPETNRPHPVGTAAAAKKAAEAAPIEGDQLDLFGGAL